MVKAIKISLLTAVISLLSISCCNNPMGFDSKKWGNIDDFVYKLSRIINFYTRTFDEHPNSIDDILTFVDGMDNEAGEVFDNQYEFLLINKDKLIILSETEGTESYVAIYYKKVKDRNLVIKVPFLGYCDEDFLARIHFFDRHGHYTPGGDEAFSRRDSITKSLMRISHKFPSVMRLDTTKNQRRFSRIGVEYTPGKLRDLCAKRTIDYHQSLFFTEVYEYLDSIAVANDYSRIIVPSFVDKAIQYND